MTTLCLGRASEIVTIWYKTFIGTRQGQNQKKNYNWIRLILSEEKTPSWTSALEKITTCGGLNTLTVDSYLPEKTLPSLMHSTMPQSIVSLLLRGTSKITTLGAAGRHRAISALLPGRITQIESSNLLLTCR